MLVLEPLVGSGEDKKQEGAKEAGENKKRQSTNGASQNKKRQGTTLVVPHVEHKGEGL